MVSHHHAISHWTIFLMLLQVSYQSDSRFLDYRGSKNYGIQSIIHNILSSLSYQSLTYNHIFNLSSNILLKEISNASDRASNGVTELMLHHKQCKGKDVNLSAALCARKWAMCQENRDSALVAR